MSKAILVLKRMPKCCEECKFCSAFYHCEFIGDIEDEIVVNGTKDLRCPLKPLPKGHGRLGDLDALEKEMINGIKAGNLEDGFDKYTHINNVDDCVECVRFADSIIEADAENKAD